MISGEMAEIIAENLENLAIAILNHEEPDEDEWFALGYATGYFRNKEEEE